MTYAMRTRTIAQQACTCEQQQASPIVVVAYQGDGGEFLLYGADACRRTPHKPVVWRHWLQKAGAEACQYVRDSGLDCRVVTQKEDYRGAPGQQPAKACTSDTGHR